MRNETRVLAAETVVEGTAVQSISTCKKKKNEKKKKKTPKD